MCVCITRDWPTRFEPKSPENMQALSCAYICKLCKAVFFVIYDITYRSRHSDQYHFSARYTKLSQSYKKFENFTGLYFTHLTILYDQTFQFY